MAEMRRTTIYPDRTLSQRAALQPLPGGFDLPFFYERARLTKTAAEYAARRAQLREGPYEVLLAAGRTEWEVGEQVRFYRAVGGQYVWLPENSGVPVDEADSTGEPDADMVTTESEQHDYDIPHYLQVLHASYVSRLRKAFRDEDFAQLFHRDGQLGLFDQPLDAISPIWIRAAAAI